MEYINYESFIECYGFEEATIEEIQAALASGETTSRKLVMYYLHRIAKYDKGDPCMNSVLEINPDAIQIAEALDEERQRKGPRSALHGVPVLLKDNIETGDKMTTSAGSLAFANWKSKNDAFLVKKLRETGVIILGKTNMTELANAVSTTMPAGYSSKGGQVLNPYGPGEFFVGGSSSGSAVAVSCNFAVASIGTETSASLLSPAIQNSIVTIKPTYGLVSRSGVIPFTYSQDVAGPMTRTVADSAFLLQAITGIDENDEATKKQAVEVPNYMEHLKKNGLQGKRIGVFRDVPNEFVESGEYNEKLFEEAVLAISSLGAEIIDPINLPVLNMDWDWNVSLFELKHSLNHFLASAEPHTDFKTFDDLLAYFEENEEPHRYGFNKLINRKSVSSTLASSEYIQSKLKDLLVSQEFGIDRALEENQLDAILFPTYCGADIAARAGYPSIAVPAGYNEEGRPFGITFTAKAFSEPTIIEIAYAFEQGTKHRRKPIFKN